LHLGNILVGPNGSAFLIDFAQTRDGHTLFDWASLELGLLSEIVMPVAGDDWKAARTAAHLIADMNVGAGLGVSPLSEALRPVSAVREIVRECLSAPDYWQEYYVALAMASLRAYTWETMAVPGRRLMFLIAALMMDELKGQRLPGSSADTLTTDMTEVTDQ
jgi:hypothetical protein